MPAVTQVYRFGSGGAWAAYGRANLNAASGKPQAPNSQGVSSNVGAERLGPLTTYNGTITISTNGQVVEGLDIHGLVQVSANVSNWIIRRCRIRGTDLSSNHVGESGTALIKSSAAGTSNGLIEDCTLIPDYPSYDWDGIYGHDFTMRRCALVHCSDGLGIFNTAAPGTPVNVTIDSCYINWYCYSSPTQSSNTDKQSHNDCVQILGGTNITITNNVMYGFRSMPNGWAAAHGLPDNPDGDDPFGYCGNGASPTGTFNTGDASNPSNPQYPTNTGNSAIQFNQTQGTPGDLIVAGNWFDGGAATLNIAVTPSGSSRLTNNRFGRGQRLQGSGGDTTYTILGGGSALAAASSGNVYDDNGHAVDARWS